LLVLVLLLLLLLLVLPRCYVMCLGHCQVLLLIQVAGVLPLLCAMMVLLPLLLQEVLLLLLLLLQEVLLLRLKGLKESCTSGAGAKLSMRNTSMHAEGRASKSTRRTPRICPSLPPITQTKPLQYQLTAHDIEPAARWDVEQSEGRVQVHRLLVQQHLCRRCIECGAPLGRSLHERIAQLAHRAHLGNVLLLRRPEVVKRDRGCHVSFTFGGSGMWMCRRSLSFTAKMQWASVMMMGRNARM